MCTHSFDHITSKCQKTTTTTMMMNECNLYALLLRLCTWTRLKVYCGKNKCIEWMMITKKKVSWWWWYGWTVWARKKKQVLRLTYLDSVSLREGRFNKKISKMMIHRRKKIYTQIQLQWWTKRQKHHHRHTTALLFYLVC